MKNYGRVRGGTNEYARLFLNVSCDRDEEAGIVEGLRERFIFPTTESWGNNKVDAVYSSSGAGVYVKLNTRRGFSMVPAIVRWAASAGRDIKIAHWDGEAESSAKYPSADFFRAIAEAACFFGDA